MKRLPRELMERLSQLEARRSPNISERFARMTRYELATEAKRLEAEMAADGAPWGPTAAADLLRATEEHVRRGEFPPGSLAVIRESLRIEAAERGWDWPPPEQVRPCPVSPESP